MKKLLSIIMVLTLILSMLSVTNVLAEGGVVQTDFVDSVSSNIGFYNKDLGQISSANYVVSSFTGEDGTPAGSFKVISNKEQEWNALIGNRVSAVKGGYTYFKSAMMRMNPDNTDDSKENSYYIWSSTSTSGNGTGFATKADTADEFNSAKTAWDASENKKQLAGYNNLGTQATSPSYTLNTQWQRITEAEYRDATDSGASNYFWGWGVFRVASTWDGTKMYSSTGNFEIDIDDYVIIEVPNNNMRSVAYPVVSLASASINGNKIEASFDAYDVNPLVENSASVVWQKFEGGSWVDFSNTDFINVTASERGARFRAKITSTSVPYDGETALNAVSAVKYTNEVTVPFTHTDDGSRVVIANYLDDSTNGELKFASSQNFVWLSSNVSVVEAEGIDGSVAAGFRSSNAGALGGVSIMHGHIAQKAGYTYFKSAMMRINNGFTTDTSKHSNYHIFSMNESGKEGFLSKGEDFSSSLEAYNKLETKTAIPTYDQTGADETKHLHYYLSTEWQRVTEALYRDASNAANTGNNRSGWSIASTGKWENVYTGNLQIDIDDFIVIEVPNSALKSVAYPMAYGANAVNNDGVLMAAAEIYDVNPLITPEASYQWQVKEGEAWTDVDGATSASFEAEGGKTYRAKIKAVSTPENSEGTALSAVSSAVKYTNEIAVPVSECTLTFNEFENASVAVDGKNAESGAQLDVKIGNVVIKVTPETGYVAEKIVVDGVDYVPNSNGEATVPVSKNCDVEIIVVKAVPSVSVATLGTPGTRVENGKTYVTNIAYAAFKNITPNWYGMVLTDSADSSKTLKLEAKNNAEGSFGIRVYGDALNGTYSLKPVITYTENGEEKQLENTAVEFTVTK